MSDHASSSTATQIAQNSVFERFARAGYVVNGLVHLTIGYLAIRIALAVAAVALTNPARWRLWQASPARRRALGRRGRAADDGAVAAR